MRRGEGTRMHSHDHSGVRPACAPSLAGSCGSRPGPRLRRRELALLAAAANSAVPGHPRVRCPALRTRAGYLAELGSCWYRRFPWSPVSWRMDGPHG
jgi:hypothetical protein